MGIDDLFTGLNPEQDSAVRHTEGPLLVIAGPGSGKTRVLTHRIANLVKTGVDTSQILALTFTNKAAAEMKERLSLLIDADSIKKLRASTFHSFGLRLLRSHSTEAGLPEGFSVLSTRDSLKIIKSILKSRQLNVKLAEEFQRQISFVKNSDLDPSRVAVDASATETIQILPIMTDYCEGVHAAGAVDFDDILLKARALLSTVPEIAHKYQDHYRHVLVDEYQDTNIIQYDLVKIISKKNQNLCVVGDQDQAIYGFRGATEAAIGKFVDDHPQAAIIKLGMNYRSTRAIVEASKAVISSNPSHQRVELKTQNDDGKPVRLVAANSDLDEANIISQEIISPISRGKTVAIIVRQGNQIRVLRESFAEKGIQFREVFEQNKLQEPEEDDYAAGSNYLVDIVTAHAAKGREWDYVWVAGVEENLFPHFYSMDEAKVEEERRLFFVACSRAREILVISYCARRLLWGEPVNTEPSRFLADLPKDVSQGNKIHPPTIGVPVEEEVHQQASILSDITSVESSEISKPYGFFFRLRNNWYGKKFWAYGTEASVSNLAPRISAKLLDFLFRCGWPVLPILGAVVFSVEGSPSTVSYICVTWLNLGFYLHLWLFGYKHGKTGHTPGKRIMGIKLVALGTGDPPGGMKGLARVIIPLIGATFTLGCFNLYDHLRAIRDDNKQRLVDKLLKTQVVAYQIENQVQAGKPEVRPPKSQSSRSPYVTSEESLSNTARSEFTPGNNKTDNDQTVFSCFDFETTHLDAKKGYVIEAAVVQVTASGEWLGEWTSLINAPTTDLGRSDIHGIFPEMLYGAPTFSEIAGDLIERFSGCIPVAHNASFDTRFLLSEWERLGLGPLEFKPLDTLAMARNLGLPRKLSDLAEYYGVPLVDAHQALDDTRALAQVLIKLLKDGAEIGGSHQFQPPISRPEPSGQFHLRPI